MPSEVIAVRTVNMHEAKTQLSKLVEAAERGEEIVIARHGKPAARLVPLQEVEDNGWPPELIEFMSHPNYGELEPDFLVQEEPIDDLRDPFAEPENTPLKTRRKR